MERIDERALEAAKDVPIEDILAERGIQVLRHKALCPFHNEKTPSFSVGFKGKNRYKCFGCGESGDSVELVMKLDKVDFATAIRNLTGLDPYKPYTGPVHIGPSTIEELVEYWKEREPIAMHFLLTMGEGITWVKAFMEYDGEAANQYPFSKIKKQINKIWYTSK